MYIALSVAKMILYGLQHSLADLGFYNTCLTSSRCIADMCLELIKVSGGDCLVVLDDVPGGTLVKVMFRFASSRLQESHQKAVMSSLIPSLFKSFRWT